MVLTLTYSTVTMILIHWTCFEIWVDEFTKHCKIRALNRYVASNEDLRAGTEFCLKEMTAISTILVGAHVQSKADHNNNKNSRTEA